VDFLESPEHHDLRDAIGAVTDKYGPSYFAEHASAHEPTTELWQELAKHGFIGINLPEEYGGAGAGMTELAIVCEETAAHGCPLLLPLVSSAISGELLTRYGSDEQRRDWLPRMVSRETEGVFAITEPNAGSNSHQLTTYRSFWFPPMRPAWSNIGSGWGSACLKGSTPWISTMPVPGHCDGGSHQRNSRCRSTSGREPRTIW
jgi:hypothetical protein